MRAMTCLAGLVAVVALSATGVWADEEEKVPLDKLPAAVLQAVKDRFPRGELVEAEKEVEDGKTEYEISLKCGGHEIEVMVTPEGKITTIEKVLAVEDLPRAVSAAVKAKYPQAKMKKAEEVIKVADGKETLEYYEVIIDANGKSLELEVLLSGKVKSEEKSED